MNLNKNRISFIIIALFLTSCITVQIPPTTVINTPIPEKNSYNGIDLSSRANQFVIFLDAIVKDPQYNPNNSVLHKYLPYIYLEIDESSIGMLLTVDVDSPEEFVSLGADLLHLASIFSYANLEVYYIELVAYGNDDSIVKLFLDGSYYISGVANGNFDIYEVMESDVQYGN